MFRGFALRWTTGFCFIIGAIFASTPILANDENTSFRVKDIEEGDVLYVHDEPDAKAKIVGALPSDAKEIRLLRQKKDASADWKRVSYRDIKGWVPTSSIEVDQGDDKPRNLATRLSCLGADPAWNLTIADGKALFIPFGEARQLLYTRIPKMAVNRASTWAIEAQDSQTEQEAVFLIRSSGACVQGTTSEKQPYEMFGNFTNGAVLNGCCEPY